MDALVRQAGDFLSVKSRDLGFFHKSRRKTHASRLASHFRYCQPNECSPSLTRASDGGDVLYSKLDQDTGWLKVTKFPGAVGVEIANQITKAVQELAECKRLILDLRGNESGGLAFVRVASYLTPHRRTIGYSVTRAGAARGSVDSLKRFGWIPGSQSRPAVAGGEVWLLGSIRSSRNRGPGRISISRQDRGSGGQSDHRRRGTHRGVCSRRTTGASSRHTNGRPGDLQ